MTNGFGITPTQQKIAALRPRPSPGTAAGPAARPRSAATERLLGAAPRQGPGIAQGRIGGTQRASLIQENPLQAIGLVLSNIAAGFQGRELPTEEFERQRAADEEARQRRVLLGIEALSTFVDLGSELDEEGRQGLAAQLNQFGLPIDFTKVALQPTTDVETVRNRLVQIDPAFVPANPDQAAEIAFDDAKFDFALRLTDQKHGPSTQRKLAAGIARIAQFLTPELVAGIREATVSDDDIARLATDTGLPGEHISSFLSIIRDGTVTSADLAPIAEAFGLNAFERGFAERNQEALVSTFAQAGLQFVPGELESKILEERVLAERDIGTKEIQEAGKRVVVGFDKTTGKEIFRLPIGEVEAEFAADEFDRAVRVKAAGGDISGFSEATRKLLSGVGQEQAASIEAMRRGGGIQITKSPDGTETITIGGPGITPGERRAGVLGAELEFEEAKPVPPEVMRLGDLPPDLKNIGEARQRGFTVPSEERLKNLSAKKGAAQAIMRGVGEMFDLIVNRPDITSTPGALMTGADVLITNVAGLLRLAGVPLDAGTQPGVYIDKAEEVSITRGRFEGAKIALGYAIAGIQETGRFSDPDIERAILQLQGDAANPQKVVEAVIDVMNRYDARFADEIENTIGNRPMSVALTTKDRKLIGVPAGGVPEADLLALVDEMTAADVAKLSASAVLYLSDLDRRNQRGGL